MSKTYEIEIEEISQKIVRIEADSLKKAISIAEDRYMSQEYELDFKLTNFREYKNEITKQKNKKVRER